MREISQQGDDGRVASSPTSFTPIFDLGALVRIASQVCDMPISLVTLVGEDRQWFRVQVGLPEVESTTREESFCAHAIQQSGLFEVPDARNDPRFADNPVVTGAMGIRFYAGVPLVLQDGSCDGALCVIDTQPRSLTDFQRGILVELAHLAVQMLEDKRTARMVAELKALNDFSPLGVFVTDPEGSCIDVNAKWSQIYEMTPEEARGTGWTARLHPDDLQAVAEGWRQSTEVLRDFEMEFRLSMPDGRTKLIRALSHAFHAADGTLAGHVGSVEDVTEARAEQVQIELKRNRLNRIIEATGAATFEWHVPSGKMQVSERWAALTGHRLEDFGEITMDVVRQQYHPEDRLMLVEKQKASFADASSILEFDGRKQHKDGHWVWINIRARVTSLLPDGTPEWVSGVLTDVSERKRQEESLRRSESLLAKTGEVAGVGGWDLDLLSGTLTWTDQTCLIHGLPPGYKPQLSQALDFYAPSSRPVIQAAVDRAMVTGQPWDLELQIIRADGQPLWVRAVGAAELDGGKPIRIYGAFQDIDARVRQQRSEQEAHKRVTLAKESGSIGVWEWEPATGTLTWDAQMFALYGLPGDSSTPPTAIWESALHPDDRGAVDAAVSEAMTAGARFDAEFRIRWPDGTLRILRSMADPAGSEAEGQKLIGVNWDVTEARANARELAEQHRLIQVTLRSIGDAVITTDAEGAVTWLNPVAEMMTGWPMSEALGRPLAQIFKILDEATLLPVESPATVALARGETVGMADGAILISRDGREYGIEDSASPIKDEDGTVLGVVLVFHDVTTERRLSGEMTWRATHDPMTGTKNRVEFEERLERVLDRARTEGSDHAMMFIDLDHFKLINDSCGHAAGDEVLRQVAKIMADGIRARDTLARLGGDEFGIVLEHCSVEVAERIAQTICDKMEAYRFVHDERRFRVGASIGVVPVDARWVSVNAALQAADSCCAVAKETGRNRVHRWQDSDRAIQARLGEEQWATRLGRALDEGRFQLYAQEIVPLTGAGGRHLELLLRLVDESGQVVLPGQFLPSAERFNVAGRIDLWVLRQAVALLQDADAATTLSVNLSGWSVGDRTFHRQAVEVLQSAGTEVCSRLLLEITETAAVANIADAAVFIDRCMLLGPGSRWTTSARGRPPSAICVP